MGQLRQVRRDEKMAALQRLFWWGRGVLDAPLDCEGVSLKTARPEATP